MKKALAALLFIGLLAAGAAAWRRWPGRAADSPAAEKPDQPVTKVKRGNVTITVSARGELQGGNSEMLVAPMVASDSLTITELRTSGEVVEAGDTVIEFDSTPQEFNMREAEADQAEAEQQVVQAQATSESTQEETQYAALQAESDVKLAKLEQRRNPLLAPIVARQNDIAVEAAENRLRQAQQDLQNKKANSEAGIAIQQAALNRAKVTVETTRKMIESMTVKAKSPGYVSILVNSNLNFFSWGMQLPPFQVGDTVRPGMAVAQIPDMHNWEVSANVGELDRGHLSVGQKVSVAVVALAGKSFPGHIKNLGGTAGPDWDRRFETKIALDQSGPDLRPGMSSNLVITAETLDNVLWVPSQALYEADGRSFVYLESPAGFMPHDVTLVKRSESQAVITGVKEGDVVALSNPDQSKPSAKPSSGAMKALEK
jgi:multidrug efflux pump subunit AcrA (membrane-fusion protein)